MGISQTGNNNRRLEGGTMIRPYQGIYPQVDESAFVEDSAQVIGDVVIGPHSSVWYNAIVRGDIHYIRIGSHTNIQDGAILHVTKDLYPIVIGDYVTIGHGVTLHGCQIGSSCLISIGTIVLDNVKIGDDCIIAAGTVVSENSVIPPRSFVTGIPGKIKREIHESDLKKIRQYSLNYIEYKNIQLQIREQAKK